ncbi:MAG: hypothetical protein R6U37_06150 [Dehalococcoidia bacterium]
MKEIIDTMSRHEELISRLYQTYALTHPDMAEFWNLLSLQEIQHRDWLNNLAALVGTGKLHFDKDRFRIEPLRLAMEYIEQELYKAQHMAIPLEEALNKALYIEESMIEQKFFEVFESDSVDMKHVLQNLEKETKGHIEMIRKERASLK